MGRCTGWARRLGARWDAAEASLGIWRTGPGLVALAGGIDRGMAQRDHDEQPGGDGPEGVPALVEAQLEAARAEVFAAYVRSRDQARRLAEDELDDEADRRRRAP
jgi:hypothetical protein